MAGERYTQEFKIAAVRKITQEGHSIPDSAGDYKQVCCTDGLNLQAPSSQKK